MGVAWAGLDGGVYLEGFIISIFYKVPLIVLPICRKVREWRNIIIHFAESGGEPSLFFSRQPYFGKLSLTFKKPSYLYQRMYSIMYMNRRILLKKYVGKYEVSYF